MTPEESLTRLKTAAESTLGELMHHLNHAPHLAAEVKPLMLSGDILRDFRTLSDSQPETAEQLLRMSLATLVNYHTTVETAAQLKSHTK